LFSKFKQGIKLGGNIVVREREQEKERKTHTHTHLKHQPNDAKAFIHKTK
jgi:hypothetical protein